MKHFTLFSVLIILLLFASPLQAAVSITVNGYTSGASLAQGDTMTWTITGLSSGATVANQLWIDLDSNGVASSSSDMFFVSFSQTDGVSSGNSPSDADGSANGTIYTVLTGISFPIGHYIFITTDGTDTVSATFTVTTMTSPTYSISGSVTKSGSGVQNVVVKTEGSNEEYFALTDANGSYTILTNAVYGTVVRVSLPSDFNSAISGYVVTPSEDTLTLTTNFTGINFVLTAGKIITGYVKDTLGNPLSYFNVSAYPPNGGNNYNGTTDETGKYIIAVPTGLYRVQFGYREQTNGYVLTYYNQSYVQWLSDTINITSSTDTVKNIDAVLRKGGVITGTVSNTGSNGWLISAFQYGISGNASMARYCDDPGIYYFTVLPGTYSIQFSRNGDWTQFYYNQCGVFPGTAVTVSAIGDTVRNIDADFDAAVTGVAQASSVKPKEFSLSQNYPNPFNPTTTITFTLAKDGMTTLKIYDMLGREVAALVNGNLKAGVLNTVTFNASKLSSGVYFSRLQNNGTAQIKKLVLMK